MNLNLDNSVNAKILKDINVSLNKLNVKFVEELPKGFKVGESYEVSLIKDLKNNLVKLITDKGNFNLPKNLLPENFLSGKIFISEKKDQFILNFKENKNLNNNNLDQKLLNIVKKALITKKDSSDILKLLNTNSFKQSISINNSTNNIENIINSNNSLKTINSKEVFLKNLLNNNKDFKEIVNLELKKIDLNDSKNIEFKEIAKKINLKPELLSKDLNSYKKLANIFNEISNEVKYTEVEVKEKLTKLINVQKEKITNIVDKNLEKVVKNNNSYNIEDLFKNRENITPKTLESLSLLLKKTINSKFDFKEIEEKFKLILKKEELSPKVEEKVFNKFSELIKKESGSITDLKTVKTEMGQETNYKEVSSKLDLKEVVKKIFSNSQSDINDINKRTTQNNLINQLKNIEQTFQTQEIFDKLNPLLKATDQPIFILFPNLIRNFLSNVEVSFLQSRLVNDEDEKKKNRKSRKYNYLKIKVSFPKLGDIYISFRYNLNELYIEFIVSNKKTSKFLSRKLEILKNILSKNSNKKIYISVKQDNLPSILPDTVKDLVSDKEIEA